MKISVITVVYNNEKTINTAIESVLGQSHKDIEYIIVDGLSKDRTLSIVSNYNHNNSIKLVSEKDEGLYDAMNKGIRLATGDIVGFLNSDDVFEDENVLLDINKEFIMNPALNMIYGNLTYVDAHNLQKIKRTWISTPYTESFFEDGNVPPHPTLYVKNEVYRNIKLFDISYKLAADYELMLRLFKQNQFKSKYLPRFMVRMRLGGATNKNLKNIIQGNLEILNAWNKNNLKPPRILMIKRIGKRLSQFFK